MPESRKLPPQNSGGSVPTSGSVVAGETYGTGPSDRPLGECPPFTEAVNSGHDGGIRRGDFVHFVDEDWPRMVVS